MTIKLLIGNIKCIPFRERKGLNSECKKVDLRIKSK